ncbi:MAG: sigma 54-interacting transcriptional regulator [Planctomycetes bacterium]|nr:sigma 54-interacting transcriptional regulator [Planctomycetota bacterium]
MARRARSEPPPPEDEPASNASSETDLLRRILEGTARATGEEFFRALVRNLALALHASHAFVAEITPHPSRVRTLAFFGLGRFLENVEYEVADTPCEEVLRGKLCLHPRGVQRRFPSDRALVELGVESYLGFPLVDAAGQVLGHLAVMDTRPRGEETRQLSIFEIFAARAAAELERLRMQERLLASEKRFRDLFEEAPIGYVYEDTQTRFVSCNRAALEILGLRAEDVPGTVGLSLVAPTEEAQQRVHDSLAAEQRGIEKASIELELRRKADGKPVWIQRFSRPEPDGKHTRTMLVDITSRVVAERERNRLRHQNSYLREELRSERDFEDIIGSSPPLQDSLSKLRRVAPTDSTVLLLGETGTGKELLARALHQLSRRKDGPLVKLNCAALPAGLIESELFGHEKGAFTGATERRVGRFALADGGTIFLDEIGDVPLDVQVRLLRVLQEQEFEPVGSSKTMKVDVRVVAATHRDLTREVAAGRFRSDLYYRLAVFPIAVPPLRERRGDVAPLTRYFASRYAAKLGKSIERIAPSTLELLERYAWPGNIRELMNLIERAVILCAGAELEIDPAHLRALPPATASTDIPPAVALTAEENERRHLAAALAAAAWVIEGPRGAARALGLHPNTLRSRMKRFGLARPHESS